MNPLWWMLSKLPKFQRQMTPADAAKQVSQGLAVLVDVRELSEISQGMAEPALWLATSEIKKRSPLYEDFLNKLDRRKTVIVYCAAGVRAAHFADDLAQRGFRSINLGGFSHWKDASLPIKTSP